MNDVISGAHVFTGERSARGYRLNRMANMLSSPEHRARFKADEAGYLREMGLPAEEIALVARRDWKAMMDHGASIYLLLKIGAVTGHSIVDIGAHTGGTTAAAFHARKGH